MKILNFGSCNVDYVYGMEHITKIGETNHADSLNTYPGGKGLNQSIAIARAGASVFHAGAIGKDGSFLKTVLEDDGVNTDFLSVTDGNTGNAIIQVDEDGNNAIIVLSGANFSVSRSQIDGVLQNFGEGDMITLQNEISNVDYIVEKAYEKKMKIFFNPSPFNERVKSVDLSKVSYLIVNEVEANAVCPHVTSAEFLKKMKEKYPDLSILLTLGCGGSAYIGDGEIVTCPAFKVNAVDTTAAGDTFTGYFIYCLSKGYDVKKALTVSSCASAIAVSKKGASSSIPLMSEVKSSLSTMEKYDASGDKILREVNDYIEKNICNATVEGVANVLGYSPNYVGKVIKSKTGKSFCEILNDVRLEVAAETLLSSDMNISDVINKVGYSNESYFRKTFVKKYGVKPLEYRKRRI